MRRASSSSLLLLLLLLLGGGGGAVAAACRLLGVGRPASVGVAAAAGVATTVADCADLTTCSWFRTTGIVLFPLSLVAGADLFSVLTVRLVAFGLTLLKTGHRVAQTLRLGPSLVGWRDSCRAVRNPHVHR